MAGSPIYGRGASERHRRGVGQAAGGGGQRPANFPGSSDSAGRVGNLLLVGVSGGPESKHRDQTAPATGSEAVSGRAGDYSGNLRAVGASKSDDRRSQRGTGRAECGCGWRAPLSPGVTGRRSPSLVREAGDLEAGELARDKVRCPPFRAVLERCFRRLRRAGLSHC